MQEFKKQGPGGGQKPRPGIGQKQEYKKQEYKKQGPRDGQKQEYKKQGPRDGQKQEYKKQGPRDGQKQEYKRNDQKDYQKKFKTTDQRESMKKEYKVPDQRDEWKKEHNKQWQRDSLKKEYGSASKPSICPISRKCGGCQFIDMPYQDQLKKKQQEMKELLGSFCKVYPITGMENPFHYRNKVHAVFGHRKGEAISGVYEEGTHNIVPVDNCLIENEKADEIIVTIRNMLKSFKIRTYDEDTEYGLLRHVLIRCGHVSGQIMVVLVTASPVFPSKNNFVKALREKHPEITTVVQNINPRGTSMVLGDREQVLYGKGYIEDTLCGCRFRISSRSFYQINSVQTEKLYAKAIELAALIGKETVLDAYCGTGTIGIIASGKAKEVVGVELNTDAFRDAIQNAKLNDVKNIRFFNNDATKFMLQMAEQGAKVDVVLMDPPRSGSTQEFIQAVKAVGAKRVVYVSCGPDTLARDLEVFQKNGYQALGAYPYDLFPETRHVETVVLLSDKKVDSYVNIDLAVEKIEGK